MTPFLRIPRLILGKLLSILLIILLFSSCEDDISRYYTRPAPEFTHVSISDYVTVTPHKTMADFSFTVTPPTSNYKIRLFIANNIDFNNSTVYEMGYPPANGKYTQQCSALNPNTVYYYRIEAYTLATVVSLRTDLFRTLNP